MRALPDKTLFSSFTVATVLEDNCPVLYNGPDTTETKKVTKENEIWKKKWGVSITS